MEAAVQLKLLTKRQVADLLGVSERTIDNWVKLGLRPMKLNRVVRFDPADLRAFIEQNKEG